MGKTKTVASEFASAWHRDAYIAALGREIGELEQRLEAVVDEAPNAELLKAELQNGIKAAKAELARVKKSSAPKDEAEPEPAAEPAAE